jgi:hypothetical protein
MNVDAIVFSDKDTVHHPHRENVTILTKAGIFAQKYSFFGNLIQIRIIFQILNQVVEVRILEL